MILVATLYGLSAIVAGGATYWLNQYENPCRRYCWSFVIAIFWLPVAIYFFLVAAYYTFWKGER